jgi:predicted nucleic acid-binding protein
MIVLDANILIRAVLGRRVLRLLEKYSGVGMRFLAPDSAFWEAHKHLPRLLEKIGKPASKATDVLEFVQRFVESVDRESYVSHEHDAKSRLSARDEDDWPVLALALALDCPIWTEDMDFFGTGCAIWTTSRVEIFLESQRTAASPDGE